MFSKFMDSLLYLKREFDISFSVIAAIKTIVIFLIGYSAQKLYDGAHKTIFNYFKSKGIRKRLRKQEQTFRHNLNILPLGSGSPYDNKKGIYVALSNKSLYVGFPSDLLGELKESFNKEDISDEFVLYSDSSFDNGNSFSDLALSTGIPDLPELIAKHRNIVARHFIEKTNGCHFNKEKLGVYRIRTHSRHGENELPTVNMELFQTDYFTHKVFRSIYKELMADGHAIADVDTEEELNKYNAFTTSFGVNCLMILNHGAGVKEYILTKRSRNATEVQSRDQYNISMLEGLTITDKNSSDRIDLSKCVERGFCEELGIENIYIYDSTIKFYDVFLEKNHFELGITCAVETSRLSFEELLQKAEFAKDRTLEISDILRIDNDRREVEAFIHANEFKQQAQFTLQRLVAREDL
ncbi:hypothetical protein DFQ01_107168 [Paenibacillus cellulosilyticus]|uniref:Nudix hydrolase domain-containing protein n=1 Tax=Paenibacillus cellulosilyticus TaxID=375489 RepID=A0A2V2YUZ0_9BACL|nr:hypothetical protein [Paenibacillus cellulosilyticus]PWW03270.1 hypothetical protein DFQ01_107168 [Paenibacillus cellulosilyticus]QKS43749.1 hypothetical protein HUB94_04355 [Paenibacillus cellulosilyticus]